MANNIEMTNIGGSPTIATDEIGADVHYQKFKQAFGVAGVATQVSHTNPLPVTLATGADRNILTRFLDTDGDGGGTKNANSNYSGAAEIFYIQPGAGEIYEINRLIVTITDTNGMQYEEYGNLGAALTNGITVRVQNDSGTLFDLTDGVPVKTNALWGAHCFDVEIKDAGTGIDYCEARWSFIKSGVPIYLDGDDNQRLEVVLNDDLSGLLSHYYKVDGYEVE